MGKDSHNLPERTINVVNIETSSGATAKALIVWAAVRPIGLRAPVWAALRGSGARYEAKQPRVTQPLHRNRCAGVFTEL